MATEPLKENEVDPQTRARARKALHERKALERKQDIEQLQADFNTNRDNPVVVAMLEKARALSHLHLQMAKDGVGIRATGARDERGELVSETVFFTNDKRITELDKSAGLDEFVTWAERQLGVLPQPVFVGEKPEESDEDVETPAPENGPAADTTEEPTVSTGEKPQTEKTA